MEPFRRIKPHPRTKRLLQKQLRHAILKTLGGKCVHCDFDDHRALQIDHINNDGYQDRKELGSANSPYYRHIMAHLNTLKRGQKSPKYQLLCANCNWIKRFEHLKQRS